MISSTPTTNYTDFQALERLRREAQHNPEQVLREVATQFESLFTQMLLKGMRSTSLTEGSLLDSQQSLFYRDMYDQQLALTLDQNSPLGLADMIVQQLSGAQAERPGKERGTLPQLPIKPAPAAAATATAVTAPTSTTDIKPNPSQFRSAEDFARRMWPHAERAAQRLGQSPAVLIAQAALESNWGKAVPTASNGQSSFNLFGIKANRGWRGPKVVNHTLEFVNGLPQRQSAGFRAYDSYADSFDDYANFLQRNPRYHKALQLRHDSSGFIRAIHQAGYATDPRYAAKIERILHGPALQQAIKTLKSATHPPISTASG